MSRSLIYLVAGARPNFMKIAPLMRAFRACPTFDARLVHTGQHYDANMSQVFFDELGIPAADINLNVGSASHGAQTARMIEGIEQVLQRKEHDVVLLYGDTNSTLAGAVAAAKLHVPVAHVEAGLRSFNKRMPEEINRIVCDHCSTWLFCPTDTAMHNLAREGFTLNSTAPASLDRPMVVQCGDVMYDNSLHFADVARERSTLLGTLGLEQDSFVLVTLHRDHNTDDADRLNAIMRALLDLHVRHALPFVWPVHPRTRKMMDTLLRAELRSELERSTTFHLVPPAGFLDMVALESAARLVISSSLTEGCPNAVMQALAMAEELG